MKNATCLFSLVLLAIATPAMAQVYKCESSQGVVYSDTPCASKSGQTKLDIQADPAPTQEGAAATDKNRYVQQLDEAVKAALAANDIAKAERLAITAEQRDLIRQAKLRNNDTGKAQVADKSTSSECIAARKSLQASYEASDSTAGDPEVLDKQISAVQAACGSSDVDPTYTQRTRNLYRPGFGFPYTQGNTQPGGAKVSPMGGRAN
ncbi:DUF4124 domain-containing protein [Methylovorus menthalis]|uniref:DUF4124 domain-containing protein n=1 Tax=Methylovorus menthalis TaxID=1002227 RepID=UPI001E34549C|nr:DUF4124 domain-containing protein [Methylovorus menthalis]MCB4811595.1 DUF4124 domain-containing protein [Methylovorus menthalis]